MCIIIHEIVYSVINNFKDTFAYLIGHIYFFNNEQNFYLIMFENSDINLYRERKFRYYSLQIQRYKSHKINEKCFSHMISELFTDVFINTRNVQSRRQSLRV